MKSTPKQDQKPFYQKGIFWAAIAGGAIIIGLIVTVIVLLISGQSSSPTPTDSTNPPTANNATQKSSSDENLTYIKNYVGQNLASACDWTWGGDCELTLSAGGKEVDLKATVNSSDGRHISDDNVAKFYKITAQSLPQNTEITVVWDKGNSSLIPGEIDLTVEAIGTLKEVTKTGELERYECEAKGNRTGRVTKFIRKNASAGLQDDSYDIVACEWTETVAE